MSEADKATMQAVIDVLKSGFGTVTDQIRGTNQRLDQTNERLDQTIERLDQTNQRLDQTIERLDQTNLRQDQTIERLDRLEIELSSFRREVGERFEGMGSYLRAINGSILDHSERIYKLEQRVSKLEGNQGAA